MLYIFSQKLKYCEISFHKCYGKDNQDGESSDKSVIHCERKLYKKGNMEMR